MGQEFGPTSLKLRGARQEELIIFKSYRVVKFFDIGIRKQICYCEYMRIIDQLWLSILSELFVNLSAGYFGVAFITPSFSRKRKWARIGILFNYVAYGMLFLVMAFVFRKAIL